LALAIWFAAWSIATLPFYPDLTARLLRLRFVVLAEVVPVTTLVLLRFGYFRQAAFFYLAGTWVHTTYRIALSGSVQVSSTAYYVTLPILATWLFGFREAFWTTGVCLGSALIFALIQGHNSVLPSSSLSTPLLVWANLVQLLLTGVAPLARVLQTLRETLAAARRDRDELQQYKEHLEQLVEQRTGELVAARDHAMAANRAKDVFLSHMSHELRNPLASILGVSNLLKEEGASQAQCKLLNLLDRSGEHLLNLIDNVLEVSKIEAGQQEVLAVPCDPGALAYEVTEIMRVKAASKELALVYSAAPGLPNVLADGPKLRQMLINLLGNAIKFTDAGAVTLRLSTAGSDDAGRLKLQFAVEDTGIGIAPDDQARIFEPFVQVNKSAGPKGAGLGLAISRQFVELMGGTISLESAPERGSRFTIELPCEVVPESEAPYAPPSTGRGFVLEQDQPEWRVLIVEDDPENAAILVETLYRAGFLVRAARNVADGIELFREWRPQFIWMDLQLPEVGGAEAARQIRTLEGGEEVKIVALTASTFASEREEALAGGMDDFVRKPYRPDHIFDCMARQLGVRYRHFRAAAAGEPEARVGLQPRRETYNAD
jgi:signal transduction histidine kinase/CheY-like chemotaxis protein